MDGGGRLQLLGASPTAGQHSSRYRIQVTQVAKGHASLRMSRGHADLDRPLSMRGTECLKGTWLCNERTAICIGIHSCSATGCYVASQRWDCNTHTLLSAQDGDVRHSMDHRC